MRQHVALLILLTILGIGLFVRIYKLADVPTGFFADEASIGYNAYTILHSGKDEYGTPFPIFFQSFGDFRHPLAVYTTIPFTYFFGLQEISVRLHAVFFGVITILLLYKIGTLLQNEACGLWCAFIGATMPWLIHYNRVGFEFTIYSAFFLCSIYFFLASLKKHIYIIPFFLCLGLTIYTYQPAKLIVPLFFIGSMLVLKKNILRYKQAVLFGILLFFIFCAPLIFSLFDGTAFARLQQVSPTINTNAPYTTVLQATNNYLYHFHPIFLFSQGDPTFITRHFVGGMSPLFLTTGIWILIGFFMLWKHRKEKKYQIFFVWLILYPLSGAFVKEAPFTSRAMIGAPLFAMLTGIGITASISFLKRYSQQYALIFISVIIIIVGFLSFTSFYFTKYPSYSSDFWGWQYGARDIVTYFEKEEKNYDMLIIEPAFNAPDIFFKFYAPNSCEKCFLGAPHDQKNEKQRQLFAISTEYAKTHPEIILDIKKVIYYPNQTPAFYIGEIAQ